MSADAEPVAAANIRPGPLQALVQFVEGLSADGIELNLSIARNVRGLLITGQLTSERSYTDGVTQELTRMAGDTLPAVAVSAFADIIRAALPSPERQHEEDTLGTTPPVAGLPQFITLRDARIVVPGGPTPRFISAGAGGWWRGKLAAVDGWGLGELDLEADERD